MREIIGFSVQRAGDFTRYLLMQERETDQILPKLLFENGLLGKRFTS